MITALILLAAMEAAQTPAPTAASTKAPAATPSLTPTAGAGQTTLVAPPARVESQSSGIRTLADVARERKLANGPKAGAFSVSGAEESSSSPSVASRRECDKLDEMLAELRRSDMSSEQWSRAKKAWDKLATDCAELSVAEGELVTAKCTAAKVLRGLVGTQLSPSDADLLRSQAASNNVTTTVDGNGKKHTSEQLVFPGVGYLYLRDGYVETLQIR
jgi:hypothetical protein